MLFELAKIKLISSLSYIFPFGLINVYFVDNLDDELFGFHLIQGFVLNVVYFLFIIFYLMVKLFIGSVPVVGYLANVVGILLLSLVFYYTVRGVLAVVYEELWRAPFVGFLVETFNK